MDGLGMFQTWKIFCPTTMAQEW